MNGKQWECVVLARTYSKRVGCTDHTSSIEYRNSVVWELPHGQWVGFSLKWRGWWKDALLPWWRDVLYLIVCSEVCLVLLGCLLVTK